MIRWLLSKILGREMVYAEAALESVLASIEEAVSA